MLSFADFVDQWLSRRPIRNCELNRVSQFGEPPEKIIGIEPCTLVTRQVSKNFSAMHHDGSITLLQRLFHAVCYHHRCEFVLSYDTFRNADDLLRRAWVQSRCVLVQQQKLWTLQCRHQ